MKVSKLKQIIKEELKNIILEQDANSTWDGNCGSILTNYVGNDLKALCMKCDPGIGGPGSFEQNMNPSPCDCSINGEPLADFCRSKFPNLGLGLGTSIGTGTGTGLDPFGPDLSTDAKPEPKRPGGISPTGSTSFNLGSWSSNFDTGVKRFKNPKKAQRFLRSRIQGWKRKKRTAGPNFKKQLNAKIKHARKLMRNFE